MEETKEKTETVKERDTEETKEKPEATEAESRVSVSQGVLQRICNYLQRQPYKDVVDLITDLGGDMREHVISKKRKVRQAK